MTWPLERSGARVSRVLDTVGWPASPRVIDAGLSNVQAAANELNGQASLSHIQAVETAEDGFFFIDASGTVTFRQRDFPTTEGVSYTFGENPSGSGEVAYQPNPEVGLDDVDLYNRAEVTRVAAPGETTSPVTQLAEDTASETTYGEKSTFSDSGSLLTSDAECLARAQAIVSRFSQPFPRVRTLSVDPLGDVANRLAAVINLDLMQKVTVVRRPWDSISQSFGSPSFTQDQFIEGVSHEISLHPQSWKTTYTLFPAGTFSTQQEANCYLSDHTALRSVGGSDAVVEFEDPASFDPLNMATGSGGTLDTITVPTGYGGSFRLAFAVTVSWAGNPAGTLTVHLKVNGSTVHTETASGTGTNIVVASASIAQTLSAGDAVTLTASQDSGSAMDTVAGDAATFLRVYAGV
jgi:hypothetical protein